MIQTVQTVRRVIQAVRTVRPVFQAVHIVRRVIQVVRTVRRVIQAVRTVRPAIQVVRTVRRVPVHVCIPTLNRRHRDRAVAVVATMQAGQAEQVGLVDQIWVQVHAE